MHAKCMKKSVLSEDSTNALCIAFTLDSFPAGTACSSVSSVILDNDMEGLDISQNFFRISKSAVQSWIIVLRLILLAEISRAVLEVPDIFLQPK